MDKFNMIDPKQAALFLNLQRYIYGLSREQFEEFARGAWPAVWEHMCTKWFHQCQQNPWEFCCRLDPHSFEAMVLQYNRVHSSC
jgi:hypothetical protein